MTFNLHTHTCFSDGSSAPEEYINEAIHQGFDTLGFSDHSPVPFKNNFAIPDEKLQEYCDTISRLKVSFSSRIAVFLGLEIDFIPGITQSIEQLREKYHFDYFIGSVHLVKNENSDKLWFIDGPDIEIYDKGLKTIFNGNAQIAVTAYYRQVIEMIRREKPDIIGHLDKIKMYNRNRYFREDDPWYVRLIDDVLEVIQAAGSVVEVNTRGLYKKRSDSLFPGPEILKKIKNRNIPVTISSDAHKPPELSLYFGETQKLLQEIGIRSVRKLTGSGWIDVPLS